MNLETPKAYFIEEWLSENGGVTEGIACSLRLLTPAAPGETPDLAFPDQTMTTL
jgi:hypothetical protein